MQLSSGHATGRYASQQAHRLPALQELECHLLWQALSCRICYDPDLYHVRDRTFCLSDLKLRQHAQHASTSRPPSLTATVLASVAADLCRVCFGREVMYIMTATAHASPRMPITKRNQRRTSCWSTAMYPRATREEKLKTTATAATAAALQPSQVMHPVASDIGAQRTIWQPQKKCEPCNCPGCHGHLLQC